CLTYLTEVGTVVRIGDTEWVYGITPAGSAAWSSNKRGEPPFVQIGRSIPFSSAISSTSLPLYAAIPAGSSGSAETKAGDWSTHFTFANGASTDSSAEANPSRITTKTAGVYRVKLVA